MLSVFMDRFSSDINLVSHQAKRDRYPSPSMDSSSSVEASSERRSRVAGCFRFAIPHVILVTLYLMYLALGGVIFSVLESSRYNQLSAEEHNKIAEAELTKQTILEAYRNASMGIVKLEDGNLTGLLDSLIDTVNHPDWKAGRQKTLMMGRDWSFPSAMLFSMTTITTIGYGDLVPETVTGQAVCVVYSAFGIPYSFFLLADIGQVLALGFIRLIRWLKLCRSMRSTSKKKTKEADVYDVQTAQTQRRNSTRKPTRRFRSAMPNVTMRHMQSVRFSVDPGDVLDRKALPKTSVLNETNDKVIGMTVLSTTHAEVPSPNTNNSGLDQSSPANCVETSDNNGSTITTTALDEKKEPTQPKDISRCDASECQSHEFNDDEEDYAADEVSLALVFCTLFSYICLSAFAFTLVEDWNYGTAFYFTFITLTTVGFGDVVPEEQYGGSRFFFCLLFTVFGLAVTSMCIALVQDRVSKAGRRLLGYLDSRRRATDTEEQKSVPTSRDVRCKEG
ncbi:TWiK family of potassium channels protein 7-like isoform X1 [Lytechinus variegatus]|uniref:TWiK family of potassium channels protein 7-like isoform X1 n=2 Tax=Lytechinus variegatus TaxID=7654 RepID=UPI001BB17D92|nr:TWiK family of potassium channels protein 7-like isoform X1 [Lytechinus variegatus]